LFGLNAVIVYAAANISIPPMIPLLGLGSVELGERLLHGRFLSLVAADFQRQGARTLAHPFFFSLMVGRALLGGPVGLVGGAIFYRILKNRPVTPESETVDRIGAGLADAARTYDAAPARYKWYARMKYRMDPCYRAVAAWVPPGSFTVDLGTGLGMLPVLL